MRSSAVVVLANANLPYPMPGTCRRKNWGCITSRGGASTLKDLGNAKESANSHHSLGVNGITSDGTYISDCKILQLSAAPSTCYVQKLSEVGICRFYRLSDEDNRIPQPLEQPSPKVIIIIPLWNEVTVMVGLDESVRRAADGFYFQPKVFVCLILVRSTQH